jgi:osmotically-inducible protein OsmY
VDASTMADMAYTADENVQVAVLRELAWDPGIDAAKVGVTVDQGIVTLSGSVDTYAERIAAHEAAHRVVGVLDVANELQVELPGDNIRTDTDLAQAVRHALEWDVQVADQRITSTVSNGWVTLEGEVDDGHERSNAERAIRNLVGVRGVTNQILVTGRKVRPEDVQREIEASLERRAATTAKRINVVTSDGRVILSGQVQTWADKEAILDAARMTPGVQSVEEQIQVGPGSLARA